MDILIVKLAALGDVLRTTSLARRLKECRAADTITWVTSEAALPLLERNPHIDEVLAIEEKPRMARRFDLVLSMEEDAACARLARAACHGDLVGVYEQDGLRFTGSSAPYYAMSALNRDADGTLATANKLKAANRLGTARLWLKILGLPEPEDAQALRPVLQLSAEEREAASKAVCVSGSIGFNPGAGKRWPSKQLSPAPAARIADALSTLGRPVLLLGGPDEEERNKEILRLAAQPLVDGGTGRGLRDFAALVSWLGAVVTTDSLAFHIATSVGVPTIALVGPTSAFELETFGRGEALAAEGCSCFYRAECAAPPGCLDKLDPARVVGALCRWLK